MIRIVPNTLLFLIFSLLSREAVFLAVFMKSGTDPLGANGKLSMMPAGKDAKQDIKRPIVTLPRFAELLTA